MTTDLAKVAAERGIRYFLIAFVDLFGTVRAKLVPAAAIGDVAKSGAGFAGFASWFDMTPADPDVLVYAGRRQPRPACRGSRRSAWVDRQLPYMSGQAGASRAPRQRARSACSMRRRAKGYELKTGVECEFFLIYPMAARSRTPRIRRRSLATTSRR